jgi:long-chain acyl-CoA synthetase
MSGSTGDMFEIVDAEVRGRPMRVFAATPPSLRALWELSAGHGDATYLVYEGRRYTYADAHRIVGSVGAHLAGLGVKPGDRVAIAMRNLPEWPMAFWAIVGMGAVAVPLNAWWTGPELAYGLTDSGARVLFADRERLERLQPHLGDTAVEHAYAGVEGFEPGTLPATAIDPDDDATIMYTSGTTGRPKGAVGTHRNLCAHVMNAIYATAGPGAAAAGQGGQAAQGDGRPALPAATLLTFPLFHVGGLHSFLVPYTIAGGKVVLMYRWDAATALDLIEAEDVTAVGGVPTTMFELLDEARRQGRSLDSVAGVAAGATLVPPELVRRIDHQLAHRAAPTNGYGLTETSGAAIANTGTNYLAHPDSVGKPISPVMEVRIAAPDGTPAPLGDTGEIWLRGPTVFKGYHGLPEETAAALVDGWFRTGDVGRVDDEGFVYVVDRLKDVIIRGGENVYAAEVEAVLYDHADVAEAAIVGVPDERLGERVAAFVRLRDGATVTPDDLRDHVAGRLAAFKVPAAVVVSAEPLPRNAAGKVLKRELRDRVAERAG